MREFFHGWRRKAGVVTLVVACAMMGMWMRSRFQEDSIRFTAFSRRNLIMSTSSRISWWSWNEPPGAPRPPALMTGPLTPEGRLEAAFWTGVDFCLHTDLKDARMSDTDVRHHCNHPYWPFVLPLVLLSAYLILWKPRKQQPTASKPHA